MKKHLLFVICLVFGISMQAQSVFKHHKVRVGLSLTPFYSYRNLKSPDNFQSVINEFNKLDKAKVGYSASFNLLFAIQKRIVLETGVWFTDRGYNNDLELLVETPSGETIQNLFLKHHNKYVGVPIKLNLYLVNKKVRFFVSGGLNTGMLVASDRRVKIKDAVDGSITRDYIKEKIQSTHLIISAVAGVGLDFYLIKRLSLRFEPMISYGVYNSQKNPIDYLPYEIGGTVGLHLGFK